MSSPAESVPFILSPRGERNLAKTARHCTVPVKGGRRDWNVAPVLTVIDEHPWGWSRWVIARENYLDADAALHTGQLDLLPGFIELVQLTVIDPSQLVVDAHGELQPVTATLPRGRREWRRAGAGAGIAAVPGVGIGAFAVATNPDLFGSLLGAGSAVAITAMGGMVAVARRRGKESRSAWVSDDPDARKPSLPLSPRRRRAAVEEPVMPFELYEAIARATLVWADTMTLVPKIPALRSAHLGIHERMYAAFGASPSWSSRDLPTVIEQLHRYCDVIERHEANYELGECEIERERQRAEPDPDLTAEVSLPTDDAEDDLQRHEQQIQAYEDLRNPEPGDEQP